MTTTPLSTPLSPSAQRVQAALVAVGIAGPVRELPVPARTAAEAAAALGVEVGQIAKSLVFRATTSGRAVLVIAAGDRRVSEPAVARLVGEPIERATPEFVREHSGYAIGGVPPLGHARAMLRVLDASLQRFEVLWAAGGTPHAVFPLSPGELFERIGGVQAEVSA